MSPIAMCGIPNSAEIRLACVPFPDPCGPSNRMFTGAPRASAASPGGALSEEALVGAHDHLRLYLANLVDRDADDYQYRGAAELARGLVHIPTVAHADARRHTDAHQPELAGLC